MKIDHIDHISQSTLKLRTNEMLKFLRAQKNSVSSITGMEYKAYTDCRVMEVSYEESTLDPVRRQVFQVKSKKCYVLASAFKRYVQDFYSIDWEKSKDI